jgi:hypothetical protein
MIAWLQGVEDDRFGYELVVLLRSRAAGYEVREIPIDTICLEGNRSSHFRSVVDSPRVYGPLVKFSLSSMSGRHGRLRAAVHPGGSHRRPTRFCGRGPSVQLDVQPRDQPDARVRQAGEGGVLRGVVLQLVVALRSADYGVMHLSTSGSASCHCPPSSSPRRPCSR